MEPLWVVAERNLPRNTIECGWMVHPYQYHDTRTRLFTYWTSGSYNKTGCYDLECAGFVQTNHQWVLGGAINDISADEGPQYDLHISVSRDMGTGRWWLQVQGVKVGYFPSSRFTTLRNGADRVDFGGEIVNQKPGNKHTGTHMGSGRFAEDGWKKASYVRNIQIITERNEILDASVVELVTRAECYNLDFGPPETDSKTHFYYGGPGFSDKCFTG